MIEFLDGTRGGVLAVLAWFFVLYPAMTMPFFLALLVRPAGPAPATTGPADRVPTPVRAPAAAVPDSDAEAEPGLHVPFPRPASRVPQRPVQGRPRPASPSVHAAASRVLSNPRTQPWLRAAALRCLGRTGTDG